MGCCTNHMQLLCLSRVYEQHLLLLHTMTVTTDCTCDQYRCPCLTQEGSRGSQVGMKQMHVGALSTSQGCQESLLGQ